LFISSEYDSHQFKTLLQLIEIYLNLKKTIKFMKRLLSSFIAFSALLSIASVVLGQPSSGPPKGVGPYRTSALVELVKLDSTIKLDIRYATSNNFVGKPVYSEARAFLQRPAAEALLKVNRWLKSKGYGLLIYDAYRPWSVTKLFWDITPADKRVFVADPSIGSVHNRGCAVDVGLYDLRTGREVEMTGAYDEMTERSFVTYTGGTTEQRANRDLLRKAMEQDNYFFVFPEEWWHFNFKDLRDYAVQNIPFSDISSPSELIKP
jgi:zinc D-Ala-D-Ala dipeptidase